MTVDPFRQMLRRQPFESFAINLSDGRSFSVTHPDFVFLPPGWRSSDVIVARPDATWDFVYLQHVTSITSLGTPPVTSSRGGGLGEGGGPEAA